MGNRSLSDPPFSMSIQATWSAARALTASTCRLNHDDYPTWSFSGFVCFPRTSSITEFAQMVVLSQTMPPIITSYHILPNEFQSLFQETIGRFPMRSARPQQVLVLCAVAGRSMFLRWDLTALDRYPFISKQIVYMPTSNIWYHRSKYMSY